MSRQCDFVAISAKGRMRKKRRFVFGQNDNSALETYSRRQQPLDVASCHSLFRWHMATWNRLPMWYSSMLFFFSWQFSYSVDWTEMDRVWCSLYMFIRHVGTVNVNNINGNINIEQCMADLLSSSYRLNTYNAFIAYDVGRFCTICLFFSTYYYYTYIQCRRCALMRFHHTNESGKCINNEKYPVCCVRFLHFFFLGCSKLNKTAATTTSTQADAYDTENLIHLHRTAHIILPQKMLFYILCKFFPFFFSYFIHMQHGNMVDIWICSLQNVEWRLANR